MGKLKLLGLVVLLISGCSQGIINPPEGQDFIGTEQERQKFDEMTRGNLPGQESGAGEQVVEMTNNPQQQELKLIEQP
jgi:hypothetical protein